MALNALVDSFSVRKTEGLKGLTQQLHKHTSVSFVLLTVVK